MSAKEAKEKGKKAPRFENLLGELETIVGELEGGQIGLDEALEKYEKGIAALRQCHEVLKAAEKKIEILTKNPEGSFETRPLEEGKEGSYPKGPKQRAPRARDSGTAPAEEANEEKGEKGSLF